MHKILFLEYKFRDFTDGEVAVCQPTSVMSAFERLNSSRLTQIKRLKLDFGASFVVLPDATSCPLSPQSRQYAFNQLNKAIQVKPDTIWFDYLKFPGKWKILDKTSDYIIHKDCQYCRGVNREEEIAKFAKELLNLIPKDIKTGIFTMPLTMGDYGSWERILGQNLKELGNLFSYISPMLYHRMIKKPASYIHEHVVYLNTLGVSAQIIPIIQLKDMPDDLEDKLSIGEFEQAVYFATQKPSTGVAIFSWDQAIEKNKLEAAGKILSKIK